MRARTLLTALFALLATTTLAACGSSGSGDTANIKPAPSANQPLAVETVPTVKKTPSTTTTVPKSGPLSTEPKITVPKGAPSTKLVTKDVITGTGTAAKAGDVLTVDYVGALYATGKVFDASWSKGTPFQATIGPAGNVIAGWEQGLIGMKVGGRRELIIPPSLAYGAGGQGPIPGHATLIFIVDLLAIN